MKGAVEEFIRIGFDRGDDVANRIGVEGDQVGVAVHKGDPPAVADDLDVVAREEDALSVGTGGPMEHLRAGKVTAEWMQVSAFRSVLLKSRMYVTEEPASLPEATEIEQVAASSACGGPHQIRLIEESV